MKSKLKKMNKLLLKVSIKREYYYRPKLLNAYPFLQLRKEFEAHSHELFDALTYRIRYRCYNSFVYLSIIHLYTQELNEYPMTDNGLIDQVPFMLKGYGLD